MMTQTKFVIKYLLIVIFIVFHCRTVDAQNCISILSYGGSGNGSTDNINAYGSAIAALPATGGCIVFPAGTYLFSRSASLSLSNSTASITIKGSGTDSTELYWPSLNGGLVFNLNSPGNSVHVKELSFVTAQAAGGTGLTIQQSSCSSALNAFEQSEIRSVTFRGADNMGQIGGKNDYWTNAYLFYRASGSSVDTVTVWGAFNGTGGVYQGDTAANNSCDSIYHNITNSVFNGLGIGIQYGAHAQGITVNQTNFQADTTGFYIAPNTSGDLSQLNILNSQFAVNGNAVLIQTLVPQTQIIGNDFVISNGNSGIYMGAAQGCSIVGNAFAAPSLNNNIGIYMSTGNECIITGNQFQALQTGIYLGTGTSMISVQSNVYGGQTRNDVSNNGSQNIIGGGSP